MEVRIRNVPDRGTENGLRKFLKIHLSALSILDVHTEKPRRARFANLTFLSIDDAEKFLSHHGMYLNAILPKLQVFPFHFCHSFCVDTSDLDAFRPTQNQPQR